MKIAMDAAVSVFDWLQGEWAFSREVPGYASIRGEARVTPTGDNAARYEETALVSLVAGGRLHAKQCYEYHRLPSAVNGFDVLFCETGELFERLEFRALNDGSLEARARYVCAADVYESTFTVHGERLQVEHVVKGPKKDYRVTTVYRRMARSRVSAGTRGVRGDGYNPRR